MGAEFGTDRSDPRSGFSGDPSATGRACQSRRLMRVYKHPDRLHRLSSAPSSPRTHAPSSGVCVCFIFKMHECKGELAVPVQDTLPPLQTLERAVLNRGCWRGGGD